MTDAIAIDFGTSRTKLAYLDPATQKPELMRLGRDQPYMPSLFYAVRDSDTILWGYDAEELLAEDPAGIIDVLKRKWQNRFVFANRRKLSPQDLLQRLFTRLRVQAGEELASFRGQPPAKVCMTLPALYGPAVEKLLQDAARGAGFTEVELVPEPVAAARAWLATAGEAQQVVVLDCGGGTLDLAYLRYENGGFHLVAECPPAGDVHIGGHDVDCELLNLVREKASEWAEDLEDRQPFYLQQLRSLKERYCRGLPVLPLRVKGQEIKLDIAEIHAVFEERFIRQTCESLKSYLQRVTHFNGGATPTVLLVGGSARLKGLKEALETRCGCQVVGWERAEFATVLGAVSVPNGEAERREKEEKRRRVREPVNIEGWTTAQVQTRQRETAEVLELPGIAFCHALQSGGHGPEMMVIPSGRFRMGDLGGNGGYDEKPVHSVTIGYSFGMGRYAVTFDEYDRFCAATGREKPSDEGWDRGKRPVINVCWYDAVAYCEWLTQQTGHTYRLPSEAEWEYAYRAGTTTEFWWGNDSSTDQANYDGNYTYGNGRKGVYRHQTVPVDSFNSNSWGLYQMAGNVWEWVADYWHDDYDGAPTDGSAWITGGNAETLGLRGGSTLGLRGGSWGNEPDRCRAASRDWYPAAYRDRHGGFRVVCGFAPWT